MPSYNLLLVSGLFCALIVLFLAARRKRVALDFLADHFLVFLLATFVMARIVAVVIHGYGILDIPFFWQDAGFDLAGGALGFFITLFILTRKHSEQFLLWLDLTLLAGAVLFLFHHIGTFASGEAYGQPTDLLWGITFTNPDAAILTTLPIHPTQLYASALTLLTFIAGAIIFKKERTAGHAGVFILLMLAVQIFLLDFLRDDSAPTLLLLRFSQLFSLGFAGIAMLLLYQLRHSSRKKHSNDIHPHSRIS